MVQKDGDKTRMSQYVLFLQPMHFRPLVGLMMEPLLASYPGDGRDGHYGHGVADCLSGASGISIHEPHDLT